MEEEGGKEMEGSIIDLQERTNHLVEGSPSVESLSSFFFLFFCTS